MKFTSRQLTILVAIFLVGIFSAILLDKIQLDKDHIKEIIGVASALIFGLFGIVRKIRSNRKKKEDNHSNS